MLKTIEHWKNTLGKLGTRVRRRNRIDLGCSFEVLENRIAMSIDSPIIAGLSASPTSVPVGNPITLVATGVTDPNNDAITHVAFYRDVDNDGVLTGADGSPLATDTDGSNGWSSSVSTAGFPAGTNRYYAVARDATNLDSDPASATNTILGLTRFIDDGDSGYSVISGTWQSGNGGYSSDHKFSWFGNGSVEWRFTGVVSGTYRVSGTWTNSGSNSATAPYDIFDNTNDLARVLVNQKNAPAADVVAGGRNFQDLGSYEIVNGELVVRLTNTTASAASADAIRLEHIGPAVSASEIRVYDGSAELYDAAATINLGSTFIGTEVAKTLTVKNVGVGTLNLTQLTQGVMPAGYRLVSGYGSTTLAQGQTTTFTVALAATSLGTAAGNLAIVNNDPNEASFDIALTGVVNAVMVKDDGDSGYSVVSGTWQGPSNSGYNNDHYFSWFNNGAVEWQFSNLLAGEYRVSATWTNAANRAAAAPYLITGGDIGPVTALVNQKNAPAADATEGGRSFQHLGKVHVVNGQLVVRLTNTSATTMSADAIRLEYLLPAEIHVLDGATELTDGTSTVNYGSVFYGTPKTFTVQNSGTGTLNLTQLTQGVMPAGFQLVSGLASTSLAPGASTTFTVAIAGTTPGTVSGTLSILSNDLDERSFDINLTGVVSTVAFKDDGDSGYSVVSGTWNNGNGGYSGDHKFSWFANGVVEWRFGSLLPATYRISATWPNSSSNSATAPFDILDSTNDLARVLVNQKNAPAANVVAGGRNFQDLGTFEIVNGELVVRLTNTTASAATADAIRLEYVGPATSVSEIRVYDGSAELYDAASTINLGSTFLGTEVAKTFTVKNVGVGTLNLTQLTQGVMPVGYRLVSGYGSTALTQGQTTTFTVALAATSLGTAAGTLSIVNNDPNEASFDIALTGIVNAVTVKDDEDSGYSVVAGAWQESNSGYNNDHYFSYFTNGVVEWRFANVVPGTYRVSATWTNASNRSASAPYEVIDGTNSLASVPVNQKNAPAANATAGGRNFQHLGQFEIVNGELVVRLTNTSATTASADAIRLEYLGPATSASEVRVYNGSTELADGVSTVDFGATFNGTQRTLTVKNVGVGNLTLTQLTQGAMPAGFALVSGFGSTTLAQGQSTTFTIALAAPTLGAVSGTLSIATNDPDEGSFDIALTGIAQNTRVIDDEDVGFSVISGTWGESTGGYNNDQYLVTTGDTGVVEWRQQLTPGQYRVSAAWTAGATRSSVAAYTVLDGSTTLATREINQKFAATTDATIGGRPFQSLGVFNVTNGTLAVQLADASVLSVSADAVYLEYVGALPEVQLTGSGGSLLVDGAPATILDFGDSERTNKSTKAVAVTNTTGSSITLTHLTQGAMPTGYALVDGLGSLSLAAGATTYFSVRLDAIAPGTYAGTIAIASSAATFNLGITGEVLATDITIDDGAPDFQTTGSGWATGTVGEGVGDDYLQVSGAGPNTTAKWTFEGLSPGAYVVYATFAPNVSNTAAVPYKLYDGAALEQQFTVNQQHQTPEDCHTPPGPSFEYVGQVSVESGTLTVELDASGAVGGKVVADAVRVKKKTAATLIDVSAPSEMITGSAETLSATLVDPNGTLADTLVVYRDANRNSVLDLGSDTRLLTQASSAGNVVSFDLSNLESGVHHLLVGAVKNKAVVATAAVTVTVAKDWLVTLEPRAKGESKFDPDPDYSAYDLTARAEPVSLMPGQTWKDAVIEAVSGMVQIENTELPEDYWYTFNSSAFAIGTQYELQKLYGPYGHTPAVTDACTRLIVLEDLTDSTDPNNVNDNDYDDQYWEVTVTPVPPEIIEPGCEVCQTCETEDASAVPGTGDLKVSTGSVASGSGAGLSRSVSLELNQAAAESSGLGAMAATGEWGVGWRRSGIASLVPHGADPANPDQVSVVFSGVSARVFTSVPGPGGPTFVRSNGLGTTDTFSLEGGQYVFRTTGGDTYTFNTFSPTVSALSRGLLVSQTDASGNRLEVSFNPDGSTAAFQSFLPGETTPTEIQDYVYLAVGDPNEGKVERIDIKRGNGTLVRSVTMGYYDDTSTFGEFGQLASITTRDATGNILDAKAYRYAEAPSGDSLIQYIFDSEAVRRVAAAGLDIPTAANALVAPFATNYLEYDAQNRVIRSDEQGKGCSSCAGGIGSFTYAYAKNSAAGLTPSDWHTKTTETRPDGTERIVYSNGRLQPMLEVTRTNDGGTPRQFGTFTRYDSRGLAIWTASPEAVLLPADLSVIEQYGDLLNEVSGNYQYISDSSGLINVTSYFTGTTATATTAGSADRRMSSTAVQRGDTGTPILQSSYTYFVVMAGGETDTQIASRTEYVTTDGTVTNTTTYAYTYVPGTTRLISQATTLPVVSAAENGSGIADISEQVFDSAGRMIWSKDADGFLRYRAYDPQTGSVTKTIADVDTTQTADFADLPAGWTTPSGGGLHLMSTYEVDSLGRTTRSTDPNGSITYTIYDDVNHAVWTYAGWNSTTGRPTGPTQISRRDLSGNYTESLTFSAVPDLDVSGRPTGTEAITNIESLSRSIMNSAGQMIASDRYFDIPAYSTTAAELGVPGTNFLRTTYAYNNQGQVDRMVNPAGTITLMRYDGRGQQVTTYVGTDDSTTDGFKWSPSNASASSNMVLVASNEYDNGGIGSGNLTSTTQYPGGAAEPRTTQYAFDWRNRLVITKAAATTDPGTEDSSVNRPLSYVELDNLGRAFAQSVFDGDGVSIIDVNADGVPDKPTAGLLRSSQISAFDSRGRAYRTEVVSVDQVTGMIGVASLTVDTFFDARGNVAMVMTPNGPVTQSRFDGAGRMTTSLTLGNIPTATWANATSLVDSVVLEQVDMTYDPAGNTILTTFRQRFHDASPTDTGPLGTPTSGIPARVSYMAAYFDVGNRQVAAVNVGTNGGVTYARPTTVPGRSDTVLVTTYDYDSAGRVQDVTDPRGIITRTLYDLLGRTTASILNYTGGAPGTQTDVTTTFQFDSSGRLNSRTAVQPAGTASQVTGYVYGTSLISGSTFASNDLMAETRYPDRITGLPSTTDRDVYTSNALGERTSFTDRAGTTHSYIYNVLGRQTADVITVLGAGVDGSIRRVEMAYDTFGRTNLASTFNAAAGGTVTSQVARAFNGFGQTVTEWQSHIGVVDTLTTPKVQYAFSGDVGGNHSRLTGTVYPDGYVVNATYSSGIDDAVSRVTSLTGQRADSSSAATLEAFKHIGMGTVIERSRPEVNIDFSLLGTAGDAGDQYAGLDRFGRVIAHNWFDGGSSTIVDGYGYTYDRGGNRLTRSNTLSAAFSETYTNDALGQLQNYVRGPSGSPTKTQDWQFDALGNWTTITNDGVAEAREANAQNELTDVGGATLTYSATGNLTTDAQGRTLAYDAWNRLVAVYDASSTLVARYEYDGMNRRIVEQVGSLAAAPTRDLYYSLNWQVLEERIRDSGGAIPATATNRYVWSPVYVDAMIARDRDADSNSATGTGGLEQRVYALQDANWNTTAIIATTGVPGHTTGDVINRFAYTPYGEVETLDASWTTAASPLVVLWNHLFQGLKFEDTTGLGYVRNRDYSASLGRFIERDPVGFKAGDNNWYRFVANNPPTGLDPTGLAEEDSQENALGDPKTYETGDITVNIGADASTKENFQLPPGAEAPPPINITVSASDSLAKAGNRWWITFVKYVELKTSDPNSGENYPRDENRPWKVDKGFKHPTSTAFVDTPGGTAPKGQWVSRTGYYAVGIVCLSEDKKTVSPLQSSFVYSMSTFHDARLLSLKKDKASFKIPDGEFPENWAELLGVTVDEDLECGC
jgi:RHS repeat-associated protein